MTTASPQRFVADGMLGRLAKWLRLLGQDVTYANRAEDSTLLRLCMDDPGARLLTRDTRLVNVRPVLQGRVKALLVRSDHLEDQLRQVAHWADISPTTPRCPVDNGVLVPQGKVEVEDDVPPYVLATQERFERCPQCGRVYWPGTHWDRIVRLLRDVS